MKLTIKKGKDGRVSVKVINDLTKYIIISMLFYLIVGELWKAWERLAYGEIQPDTFDGIVLIVLSITIGVVSFLKDLLKALIDVYPAENEATEP